MILNVCADEEPQVLLAVTIIFPLEPAVALMLLLELVPLQPNGNVQLYEVAPGSFVTEYVSAIPEHKIVLPLIALGITGTSSTFTLTVCADEVPHALLAVTVMFPPTEPTVAFMLLLVLLPLQPIGKDQE